MSLERRKSVGNAWGTVEVDDVGTGGDVAVVTQVISAAELKNLVASPVTILGAPGSGSYYFPLTAVSVYEAGGSAFTAGDEIGLGPEPTKAPWLFALPAEIGVLETTDQISYQWKPNSGSSPLMVPSEVDNKPLLLLNVLGTDFATGDGQLTITVWYFTASL